MAKSSVDRIYNDFKNTKDLLDASGEMSLRASFDDMARKTLLLAAASWFEHSITTTIVEVAKEYSNRSGIIVNFLRKKAIERQFHTYFDWDSANASRFYALFGDDFKEYMHTLTKGDSKLDDATVAFLEIGRERNRMVHEDYGAYNLEKTSDEIYDLYQRALSFVEGFEGYLKTFSASKNPA